MPTFITRKITKAIAAISAKKQDKLYLGNLKARRDWGFAPEYVECMWRMLQQENPEDYVVGTGEDHSVEEFLHEAFGYVNMDYKKYVATDPRYFRPTEVDALRADPSKAKKILGWVPKVTFKDLVHIMVDADMAAIGLTPPGVGLKTLEKLGLTWTKPVISESSHAS